MTSDHDPEDKSQELADRVPRQARGAGDPQAFMFDDAAFARHRAVLRREANVGRVALVVAILLLLVANLFLTRWTKDDLVDQINYARQGQGSMEDDVAAQLRGIEARLAVLEEQNRQLIERLAPPAAPQASATP
jgi:hypothetical protein